MNDSRPVLSLAELEAFDGGSPPGERRRFCCPLCGQGKPRDSVHRCLSVESKTGLWKCFRCDASGQLRDNWSTREGDRAGRARRSVKRAFSMSEVEQGSGGASPVIPGVLGILQFKSDSQPPLSTSAVQEASSTEDLLRREQRVLQPLAGSVGENYVIGRGLSLTECITAQVKFSASWVGRPAVVFPLYDEHGEFIAAQGRYTDGREAPKARTLGHKRDGLFLTSNFWRQVKGGAPVIITEAPIDALSLATCGFPALALCGKSGWPLWLPIKCAFKEVGVGFDADEAGEKGAEKLIPVIKSLGAKVRRVVPENAKDWNEMLLQMGKERMGDWLCLHLL